MYLFFDTETTGKPKNYQAPATDLNNWPRVIQLAWILYDADKNALSHACNLIKPDGWVVPNEKFWIDNGFSTDKNQNEGIGIDAALLHFTSAINRCDHIIAHNLSFDLPIVQAEMIRAKLRAEKKPNRFCTMHSTTDICKLPGNRQGQYKWPKLEELHRHLFNTGFDGAHDALNDVSATAKCFFELQNRQLITI